MADTGNTNDPNMTNQPYPGTSGEGEIPAANQQTGIPDEQFYNSGNVQEAAATSYVGGEQVYSAPESYSPNVAISGGGGGIPRWFYVVFTVTLIAFLVVTYFLIITILKPQNLPMVSEPTPTVAILPSPVVTVPSVESPTPTPDVVVNKLQTLSTSDEIADIAKDINETDLSPIADTLKQLDTQMKESSR